MKHTGFQCHLSNIIAVIGKADLHVITLDHLSIAFKGQIAGFLVYHGYTCIRTRKTDLLVSFCHLRSGGSGECRNKKRTGHYGTQQERKQSLFHDRSLRNSVRQRRVLTPPSAVFSI